MTENQQLLTIIGGLVVVIGYFLRSMHAEWKEQRAKDAIKDEKMETRFRDLTDAFSKKMEQFVEKMGEKINQLPRGSDNLNQAFFQMEKEIQKRLDEHSERIQNNYNRIEQIATRYHDAVTDETRESLKEQLIKRKLKRTL